MFIYFKNQRYSGMAKHSNSIDSAVLARVQEQGPGWVFSVQDFIDLGSRNAVALALMRMTKAGMIRSIARGLFELPKTHPRLGKLAASTDAIIDALRRRNSLRLQPTGAYAANLLGLSEQVPMKMVFLTDGPKRRIALDKREIILKQTTPRNMAAADRTSGTVIQALRWLGKANVTDQTIASLRRKLRPDDRRSLLNDLRHAPAWVAETMRKIAQDPHQA